MKLGHIINVTEIDETKKSSYLHIAQPVTLQSMVNACNSARDQLDIELVAIKHHAECIQVPDRFILAPNIEKYAWEYIPGLRNVMPQRPLPRLADIISGLYAVSDAEYFIYTNLDIGLFDNFYLVVKAIIDKGYDAFCINRIDLPKLHNGVLLDVSNMDLFPRIAGRKHIGIDCFIFRREIVPQLELGNVYIGYPPVGMVLKTQIEKTAKKFAWFKDIAVTYHLGNDTPWKNNTSPYYMENFNQAEGLYKNCF